jgi:hypothetical protein
MKTVIQNIVGVVVVAACVYGSVVHGVEHSMYRTPSPVVETEQDRLNKAGAIIASHVEGKQSITTKDYIKMMEELSCVEETPRIRYYQGVEIKCKR